MNDAFWPRILMFNLLASPSCLSVSACSPPHPPQPSLASHRHRRDRSQKFWSTNSPILVLPPGCPGVQNWTARDRKKKKYYIVHTRMLRIKARRNYLPFLLLSSHKRAVGSFFFFFLVLALANFLRHFHSTPPTLSLGQLVTWWRLDRFFFSFPSRKRARRKGACKKKIGVSLSLFLSGPAVTSLHFGILSEWDRLGCQGERTRGEEEEEEEEEIFGFTKGRVENWIQPGKKKKKRSKSPLKELRSWQGAERKRWLLIRKKWWIKFPTSPPPPPCEHGEW